MDKFKDNCLPLVWPHTGEEEAESPLQLVVKTMVKQAMFLQPQEDYDMASTIGGHLIGNPCCSQAGNKKFTAVSHPINPKASGVEMTMGISLSCYNPLSEF